MYSVYRDPPAQELLGQGDILDPAPLRSTLSGHQDYFVDNPNFYRYVVLTQTCDLQHSSHKAEFICIAVVRKLSEVLSWRHVESNDAQSSTLNLLRDLYQHNYNRRGFFYLPENGAYGVEEESVVDLRVMFSLHRACYPDLLRARLGAITDVYAAQLGHMVGHMFSRIATPGWEEINPNHNLGKSVMGAVKKIHAREQQILSDLLEKARHACAFPGCQIRAITFRWLPVEEVNNRWRYEQRVLCADHARQYDNQRAGRASKTDIEPFDKK